MPVLCDIMYVELLRVKTCTESNTNKYVLVFCTFTVFVCCVCLLTFVCFSLTSRNGFARNCSIRIKDSIHPVFFQSSVPASRWKVLNAIFVSYFEASVPYIPQFPNFIMDTWALIWEDNGGTCLPGFWKPN